MLPPTSRTILAIYPAADWGWDRETQSRILAKLDYILVTIENAFRDKKKSSPAKPDDQWQPEYVKEAKEELRREKHRRLSDEELENLKAFWQRRNSKARFLDGR